MTCWQFITHVVDVVGGSGILWWGNKLWGSDKLWSSNSRDGKINIDLWFIVEAVTTFDVHIHIGIHILHAYLRV